MHSKPNFLLHKGRIIVALSIFLSIRLSAQLSGLYSVPGSFTSVAAAVTALNNQGINGAVTVNIASGYTETAPQGGFVLNTITGASAANTVIFQKNGAGANPLMTAYTGTATPSSATQDGIWRLLGSDFITIDGIDLYDPNTTNPGTMEFGYGLFKTSATNGCQKNSIKNCVITLNRINNAPGAGPALAGSKGIEVVSALSSAHTTSLLASSTAGANAFNKFYSNTIQNCNTGISLSGYNNAPNADSGNDIGGASASTGNTIINYGGGGSASAAYGIKALAQTDLTIRYNRINNNTGVGADHAENLRGISVDAPDGGVFVAQNNTVTVHSAGTTQDNAGIESLAGITGTTSVNITINNNLITGCSYATATSGSFYGIRNSSVSGILSISDNTLTANSTAATSGTYCSIFNAGDATMYMTAVINLTNNVVDMGTFSAASTALALYGICNAIPVTSNSELHTSNNTFQNCSFTGATGGTGPVSFIFNNTLQNGVIAISNTFNNLALKTAGDVTFISNNNATFFDEIRNNIIVSGFTKSVSGGTVYGYASTNPVFGALTYIGNNFSNITLTGNTAFYGIYEISNRAVTANTNLYSNISAGTGFLCGMRLDVALNDVMTNTVSNLSNAGTVYGIQTGNIGITTSNTIHSNLVYSLSSSGAGTVAGLYHSGTYNTNIYQNKISDLSGSNAASKVSGIYCDSPNFITIFNNMVGNLLAPASTGSCAISGIELSGGSYNKLYYNTVRISATSSGANFGTAAIYIKPNISFEMRNNIFVNTSVPTGTGITVAFLGSNTTANQYQYPSDNNLFYAGLPAANRVIYYEGTTTFSTLALYKAIFFNGIDLNGVTENVPFLSTVGTSPGFLHIDPTIGSLVESGGIAVAGYTNDIDGQLRQGIAGYTGTGSAPDIGADEYNQNLCTLGSASSSLTAASRTLCEGQTFTISSVNNSLFQGINYQWKAATVSGGPYSAVTGGTGSLSTSYTTGVLNTPGTFYYVLASTCSVTGSQATSNQLTVTVNPLPTATISANSNTLCAGQNLNLTAVSNATTFTWVGPSFSSILQNPTIFFIGLSNSGTYTSHITSNAGCVRTGVITVTVIPFPNITAVAVPSVLCAGGTTTLYASGGVGTFTWSNQQTTSLTVVSPTLTTVFTVTNQSYACPVATASVNVVVNPLPTLSVTLNPTVVCTGVNATLSATGATSYSWNTGATGSAVMVTPTAGVVYTVTGGNVFGCTATLSIAGNALPSLSVTASDATVCSGSPVTLTAGGAGTYSWSNGANGANIIVHPVANQSYTVTGKSIQGCSSTSAIAVAALPLPVIAATSTTLCEPGLFELTASGAITYTWLPGGFSGATYSANADANLVLSVSGTNADNCSNTTTASVTIQQCDGIHENGERYGISVYPNPSQGVVSVKLPAQATARILISNTASEIISDLQSVAETETFDLSAYAKGLYFIRVYYNNTWLSYKLIVN